MSPPPSTAWKLVDAAEWAAVPTGAAYAGSAVDLADGYIHLSTDAQLAETAAKHYRGRAGLLLLAVDLDAVGAAVRWEPSRGGALFPHIYGPLPASAVTAARPLSVDAEGEMRFEDGGPSWA